MTESTENDIAIVGMACRFPGANTPDEFWSNLRNGVESLSSLSDEALLAAGVSKELLSNPNYVKSGMFLDEFDAFDAEFFGFSPLDAKILDPQHRHFLECSWEAFEDAGYVPGESDGAVGVFAGSGYNAYLSQNLLTNKELLDDVGFFLLRHTGNDKDFLATRVSYLLNLKGPSINVQTACSTSLVAVHMAAQSLLNAECDMALAGGVTIDMPHKQGYLFKESEILSPDGHCRPFDSESKGTVFGSGVGCVLLKRYDDAVADGDNIHAVVKGTAINNDGSDKVSYLAPSVDGQIAAMQEALDLAEVDPQTVSYIECHGTGTQLGDPIEIAALSQAYESEDDNHTCGIGSVKSNIGHTDTAAGVASLIKVVQSLKHQELAPTLHYRQPNPSIDFDSSPFYVNAELKDWQSNSPRRAGISSLGVGGTNAHVILQEHEQNLISNTDDTKAELIMLSAKSDLSLQKNQVALSDHLDQHTDLSLQDVSYTLATGRKSFRHRTFTIADDTNELCQTLDSQDKATLFTAEAPREEKQIAMMFAGGGSQYVNMGRDLYNTEPVYKEAIDQCLTLLADIVDFDLKNALFPQTDSQENVMASPSRGLPALFVTQYAQAKLWQSWGVSADAMIGHSMGENTAACLSGVLSLKDALGLVSLRGQLFETVERGGMIGVSLGATALAELTDPLELDIAASNAPELSVASGSRGKLDQLETILQSREIDFQAIHIDVAAHSRMLENILEPFRAYLQSITLNSPTTRFVSNLTGTWITPEQATNPDYWVDHLRNTVAFEAGVQTLLDEDKYVFLEVGPGRTLSSLSRMQPAAQGCVIESSMAHVDDTRTNRHAMLHAMGRIWQGGVTIDHSSRQEGCHKVSLPTYQFAKNKHWVEVEKSVTSANARAESTKDCQYQTVWQRTPATQTDYRTALDNKTVLLIAGNNSLNTELTNLLAATTAKVIIVSPGSQFDEATLERYVINPGSSEDYQALTNALSSAGNLPDFIIHTLALESADIASVSGSYKDIQYCFESLFQLANAAINTDLSHPMQWLILTQSAQQVAGEEIINPLQSMVTGLAKVIPSECSNINCRVIDIQATANQKNQVIAILNKIPQSNTDVLALRGNAFYTQKFQRAESADISYAVTDPNDTAVSNLREHGTYLITGGTGGLGLIAAETLSARQSVNLILLSRSALPAKDQWRHIIDENGPQSETLSRLLAIEESGSSVTHFSADIGDLDEVLKVKTAIQNTLGDVHGIIHTAGIVDDNLIAVKTVDECARVLKPKVLGTLVLNQVFNLQSLDFTLLYSSISSFAGLPGQIDYAAANSFLDAFANCSAGDGKVTSINWPAWKEDGMAARMLAPPGEVALKGKPTAHPLLTVCSIDNDAQTEYRSHLSGAKVWMLDEHRLADGTALIPGSGFIELARAAFTEATGHQQVAISDATFLLPFTVADDETKELIVTLNRKDDQCFDFTVESQTGSDRVTHATGKVCTGQDQQDTLSIGEVTDRCNNGTQYFDDPDHHPSLQFGDRWASLKSVELGNAEALIKLSLDDQYQQELNHFALHPAMLDMATGGAQALIPGYRPQDEFYVPVEYGQLNLHGQFPANAYSHVALKFHDADMGSAVFDVLVADENGHVFLSIEGFAMQRLQAPAAISASPEPATEANPLLTKTLELGIYTAEGTELLQSIINGAHLPQRVISTFNPEYVVEQLEMSQSGLSSSKRKEPAKPKHDPDSDTDLPTIETALSQHEAIEFVAVRSHQNEDGSRRLVAHYLVDDWESITVSELRKYARDVLDRSNVPQHFVEIDEIPQDDSGNLDKTALHDPFAPVDRHVAPRTPVEQQLADIWADVLGADKVSVTDNFFDIGGHSLLSIRVIVKAQKLFSIQLDQAQMVLLTLEQQANEIQQQLPTDDAVIHPSQLQDNPGSQASGVQA